MLGGYMEGPFNKINSGRFLCIWRGNKNLSLGQWGQSMKLCGSECNYNLIIRISLQVSNIFIQLINVTLFRLWSIQESWNGNTNVSYVALTLFLGSKGKVWKAIIWREFEGARHVHFAEKVLKSGHETSLQIPEWLP